MTNVVLAIDTSRSMTATDVRPSRLAAARQAATAFMAEVPSKFRIGIVAFAWNDPHIALTSATLLGPRDVAIGISHTGTTKETIEALAKARSRGATTIAITNFPLSRLTGTADITLTTAARETSLRSGATASRIAALTVVDCLYIAVAHRDLDRATKAVTETRAAVSGHHV